jgi:hypothetical protein
MTFRKSGNKKDLADGVLSKAEYMEWKVNWPQTADDCGKHEPSKKWRKELLIGCP